MPKKFLTLLGILLLIVFAGLGWRELHSRNFRKATETDTNPQQTTNTPSNQQQTQQPPAFDKTKFSTTNPGSIWVIANKTHPLNPLAYAPGDLVSVGNGEQLRKEAADKFAELVAAAKVAGLTIQPLSAYRSYQTQVSVYNKEVATYGQAVADTQSAKPGYSEHQTGLAIDIGGGGCGIEDCFGDTAEGKWVAANAHTYGFIVRYVAGKESVTGYRAEPWHIRYIGTELAAELKKQNVQTLEEFFNL